MILHAIMVITLCKYISRCEKLQNAFREISILAITVRYYQPNYSILSHSENNYTLFSSFLNWIPQFQDY